MSITETPAAPSQPPKKRRAARRKRTPAVARPKSDLAGLTIADCPAACNAERCVISGRNVCSHPRKGGLQGALMHDKDALGRLDRAQKMLGKRAMDIRFS